MVGLNVTRQVGVTAEDINRLLAGGKVAKVFGGLFAFFRESLQKIHGLSTASLHDPCALVPFIAPHLIRYRHTFREVSLGHGPARGMTVCDLRTLTPARLQNIRGMEAPNCHVAVEVDGRLLVEHIVDAILGWPD